LKAITAATAMIATSQNIRQAILAINFKINNTTKIAMMMMIVFVITLFILLQS
jgi:hypothetical protein